MSIGRSGQERSAMPNGNALAGNVPPAAGAVYHAATTAEPYHAGRSRKPTSAELVDEDETGSREFREQSGLEVWRDGEYCDECGCRPADSVVSLML
jgi:hypothetical protein